MTQHRSDWSLEISIWLLEAQFYFYHYWWFFIQKIGKTNINSYKLQIIWNFYSQRELKSVPNWSFRVISNIKRLFETVPNWIFRRERQFKITPNLFPIGFFESFLKLNFCSKLFPIGFFHAYSPHDQIKREKKVFPIGYHNGWSQSWFLKNPKNSNFRKILIPYF